jgi:hypothetical protein
MTICRRVRTRRWRHLAGVDLPVHHPQRTASLWRYFVTRGSNPTMFSRRHGTMPTMRSACGRLTGSEGRGWPGRTTVAKSCSAALLATRRCRSARSALGTAIRPTRPPRSIHFRICSHSCRNLALETYAVGVATPRSRRGCRSPRRSCTLVAREVRAVLRCNSSCARTREWPRLLVG